MEHPPGHVVYISYRWRGAKKHADSLVRLLTEALPGVDVFQDSASLRPGDHWPTALQEALERASAILVLIDHEWLRHADDYGRRRIDDPSDWVRLEIERSLSRRIPLLPVLIEDAKLPPAEALPEPLQPLVHRQAARFRLDSQASDAKELADQLRGLFGSESPADSRPSLPFQVKRLELSQFRCFDSLEVHFAQPSTLPGTWTCIAGINGAGKSSVLQAVALLLMGPERARELGGERLKSMRRRTASGQGMDSTLRAWVDHLGEELYLEMSLSERGPSGPATTFWDYAEDLLVAGYGASRHLSESRKNNDELSLMVRANLSLFDPTARQEIGEELLMRKRANRLDKRLHGAARLFQQLVHAIFQDEFSVDLSSARLSFSSAGIPVDPIELPDGFRSSIAWLADLCARWSAVGPRSESLEEMTGVVLVDEIDLHLHASLQRAIVPRLRDILPRVQWVVTSHSPLILASFDRHELIALDRSADGGVRELDRQVLGFSADEIYEWLLGTPPSSEAAERELGRSLRADLTQREAMAEVLEMAPDVNEAQAKVRVAKLRDRIQQLKA